MLYILYNIASDPVCIGYSLLYSIVPRSGRMVIRIIKSRHIIPNIKCAQDYAG